MQKSCMILLLYFFLSCPAWTQTPSPMHDSSSKQCIAIAIKSSPLPLDLVNAALRKADLHKKIEKDWQRKLSWAPAFPRINVRLARSTNWGEYFDLNADGPDQLDLNNRLDLRWEVKASWDLSRFVFDSQNMQIEAIARHRRKEQQILIDRVLKLYFRRNKLLALLKCTQTINTESAIQNSTELIQVTAALDILTDGLVTQKISPSSTTELNTN